MAALHCRCRLPAVVVFFVASLVLLAGLTHAQSNMCYPPLGKRRTPNKGSCFMVTHTLPAFYGKDAVSPGLRMMTPFFSSSV